MLVEFANDRSVFHQAAQTTQKAEVPRMVPPDEPRSFPSVGAQCIEASVIADSVIGVARDSVGSDRRQRRPAKTLSRIRRHDLGQRLVGVGGFESLFQAVLELRRRSGESSFRRTRRRQLDTTRVAHDDRLGGQPPASAFSDYRVGVVSAIDPDTVKNFLTAGSFVPLLVALVLFKVAASMIVRSVLVVVAVAIGVLVFTQRSSIDECVDSFDRTGTSVAVSCSVLGFDVDLDL